MSDDPASCLHEHLGTVTSTLRDDERRLIRVDIEVRCIDCDTTLQTDHYFTQIGRTRR